MLTRRVREQDALLGVGLAYLVVVGSFTDLLFGWIEGVDTPAKALGWHGIWAAPVGCLTTCVVGLLSAWVGRRADGRQRS